MQQFVQPATIYSPGRYRAAECRTVAATGRGDRSHEPEGLFRARSPNETDFDFAAAQKIRIEGLKYPPMYKFTHVFLEDGKWWMYFAEFIRPHCRGCKIACATSSDGLHWKARSVNLLLGQDPEIIKAGEKRYLMYFGPEGYFDAKECDIRLAIFSGRLQDAD